MRPSAQRKLPALLRTLPPMRDLQKPAAAEMTPRIYAIMAVTTVLTFATLVTGYQMLFPPHSLFA